MDNWTRYWLLVEFSCGSEVHQKLVPWHVWSYHAVLSKWCAVKYGRRFCSSLTIKLTNLSLPTCLTQTVQYYVSACLTGALNICSHQIPASKPVRVVVSRYKHNRTYCVTLCRVVCRLRVGWWLMGHMIGSWMQTAAKLNRFQLETEVPNIESKKEQNKKEICGDCRRRLLDHWGFH